MTLWLIGMMGSGKTTTGRMAAGNLGVSFFDIDDEVVSDLGHSVAQHWDESGEADFREVESATIRRLAGIEAIVSTGGGAVLDPENRQLMKATGRVVWLRADPGMLAARLEASAGRPLIDDRPDRDATIAALLVDRSRAYADAADYEIDTSDLSVEEVAVRIEEIWPS